ncbi:NADPH-dependent FMN reductase [Gordonia soli]|uniref:Putative oxidoreductase n=1 Tax=Gordonia soli NBRC 108243 TaxID=1223545 RepID=M0QJL7_9ACTN|nr:NAD(P)H-dependent oxidoreductase [Gordonia soli]GAC68649.1 putative oxidoreductase [Gordonia soli NBRC 108243]
MDIPERYVVIIASTRDGRIGPTVARWFLEQIGTPPPEVSIDVLDLRHANDRAAATLLDRADGFVIVTPEYNHSYPAPLKDFLDAHRDEWRFKPATFVSYGAMSGGIRAVEHLRTVLAELYMTGTRNTVVLQHPWDHVIDGTLDLSRGAGDDTRTFDRAGRAAAARESALAAFGELRWWAVALAAARRDLGTSGTIELAEIA